MADKTKGKINEAGALFIERAGMMKVARCFYNFSFCGDECALFGEPFYHENGFNEPCVAIVLCHKEINFSADDFTDERRPA